MKTTEHNGKAKQTARGSVNRSICIFIVIIYSAATQHILFGRSSILPYSPFSLKPALLTYVFMCTCCPASHNTATAHVRGSENFARVNCGKQKKSNFNLNFFYIFMHLSQLSAYLDIFFAVSCRPDFLLLLRAYCLNLCLHIAD